MVCFNVGGQAEPRKSSPRSALQKKKKMGRAVAMPTTCMCKQRLTVIQTHATRLRSHQPSFHFLTR